MSREANIGCAPGGHCGWRSRRGVAKISLGLWSLYLLKNLVVKTADRNEALAPRKGN